jgi:diguanylate cyclase (GGDEF)-like protein/PAS domain S-box-containing protein
MNQAGLMKLGYTLEELLSKSYWDLVPKEYAEEATTFYINQFLEEVEETYQEYPMIKKDGGIIWMGNNVRVIKKGKDIGFYSIARDITELRESRLALKTSEEKHRTILESLQEGYYEIDLEGNYINLNDSMCRMLGISKDNMIGKNFKDCLGEGSFDDIFKVFSAVYKSKKGLKNAEWKVVRKDGRRLYLALSVDLVKDSKDNITGFRGITTDITQKKHAEQALRASEEKYRSLYDNAMAAMVTICLSDGSVIAINELGIKMFGYKSRDDVIGSDDFVKKHIDPDSRDKIIEKLKRDGEIRSYEVQFTCRDERVLWCEVSARIYSLDDKIEWIIIDITKRKQAEEQIFDLTYYDQLTRLPNKDMFRASVQREIMKAEMKTKGNLFGVICVGINKFKFINNLYGTDIGDMLLIKAAERLQVAVYDKDTVSRFDGDKFMILFSEIASRDDAGDLVRKVGNVFSAPFNINGEELLISSSMGACLFPKDGETPEALIKNSEAAMFNAKEQGISTLFFDSELNSKVLFHFQLEKELQKAISNQEFIVHYQARVKVKKGNNGDYIYNIGGMESLVRWNSPTRGIVPPMQFIPLAEKNGMIIDIGYGVLKKSCEQVKEWQKKGYGRVKVSVNLSPYQFSQPDLVFNIERISAEAGLDPQWLELEITESGIMQNEKKNIGKLAQLREKGFSISIDDFGTGYSSLSKLQNYPIDTLKIDKSFIDNIVTNEKTSAIIKYIINLARDIGFDVVAEGVETKEQLDILLKHGCSQIQGYYHSKPLPFDEFEKNFY